MSIRLFIIFSCLQSSQSTLPLQIKSKGFSTLYTWPQITNSSINSPLSFVLGIASPHLYLINSFIMIQLRCHLTLVAFCTFSVRTEASSLWSQSTLLLPFIQKILKPSSTMKSFGKLSKNTNAQAPLAEIFIQLAWVGPALCIFFNAPRWF